MAATNGPPAFALPKVPVPHRDFVSYINTKTADEISCAVAPYIDYEAKLREGFAQHREHEALKNVHVNAVPVPMGALHVKPRNIEDQSLNEKYIMPLTAASRKPDGASATVGSMRDFRKNFNLFSESSLVDMDWSNVVAAGSAVVTALLPVPEKYHGSKKALRKYYHEKLAPSSDVDLFLWGLDEAAAREKIEKIEESVRNAVLDEVTTVRTKNAITIVAHYPVRHVQIVLRLYQSVSEILTGFDVDCSCFAYDGKEVYGTPRSIAAFMTQTNTIDLSRRSPSYESRLSKYAHRGFEIHCPNLDRSRIDPTIFERSFARTVGLARLLVLEQLPKPRDREKYLDQRREERGRPSIDRGYWTREYGLRGNVKDDDPDDVAEWVYEDAVSNYHSFTVPYGPKYHAKKIEKLLYTKDLLLNAEWNHEKDRTVNLHRHPCFIGPIKSVIQDCCGHCPEPKTDEEREVAEEESKIYVSGDLTFMADNPGRQTIGSFTPLTADDWTDMAYIGNTEELCQKICNEDLDFVRKWCEANSKSIDRRDHTGRTPLHIAARSSTPEILQCLVDHGSRMVARLVDGMTALHIAAVRGNAEMVAILLERSAENEAKEADKEDQKRSASQRPRSVGGHDTDDDDDHKSDDANIEDDDDFAQSGSDEGMTITSESFVKVNDKNLEDAIDGEDASDPDIYDVNVIAWDAPVSPLHLAILGGHIDVVKLVVGTFGADVLLPIKLLNSYSRNPEHAIMTLMLAAWLPHPASREATKTLLSLGASSAQADMHHISAFHYLVAKRAIPLLKACFEDDGVAARGALDHITLPNVYLQRSDALSPLKTAINLGDKDLVNALLHMGAKPVIDLDDFAAARAIATETALPSIRNRDCTETWKKENDQPVMLAVDNDMPELIMRMVDAGADINTIDSQGHISIIRSKEDSKERLYGGSLLDRINTKISDIEKALESRLDLPKPIELADDEAYLKGLPAGSYERWHLSKSLEVVKNVINEWEKARATRLAENNNHPGREPRTQTLRTLAQQYHTLKASLLKKGAKTLDELQPNLRRCSQEEDSSDGNQGNPFEPKVDFRTSCTDSVRDGYIQLFEAVWCADVLKIKELTLANWGSEQKQSHLSVATQDSRGLTSFAVACYRRHFSVAKLLVEIADLQFKDEEDSKARRYTILEEDSDFDSDTSDEDLAISSRVVDETYSFDNIGALRQSAGSQISASDMLRKTGETWCLLDKPEKEAHTSMEFKLSDIDLREGRSSTTTLRDSLSYRSCETSDICRYALACGDIKLLRFWLQCCQVASKMKVKKDAAPFYGFHSADFLFALQHGLVAEMSEMIKIAGAELPLDALVKESGAERDEKPKYYQGLSIGGRKMTDWAQQHSKEPYVEALSGTTTPLLKAAKLGALTSVEWFLSDTPFRLYKEYGGKNAENTRLKALTKAHGGFDRAVGTWLKQRSNLALHGAIFSPIDNESSLKVIEYLINVFPSSLDLPASAHAFTPLALAFLNGRTDAATALIGAGADQTTRDAKGKNLIHLALLYTAKASETDVEKLKTLFSLIDHRLLNSMATERCRDGPTGLTPLAYWLTISRSKYYYSIYAPHDTAERTPEIFTILTSICGRDALEMMDGSGQFPLHQAVKRSYFAVAELMLKENPALLTRENAMGQTPLELAESLYIRNVIKRNPNIMERNYVSPTKRKLEDFVTPKDKPPNTTSSIEDGNDNEEFIYDSSDSSSEESRAAVYRTYRICRKSATENPSKKRKLVSVLEAREVAKRLADSSNAKKKRSEERRCKMRGEEGEEEEEEEEKQDEVDWWLGDEGVEVDF